MRAQPISILAAGVSALGMAGVAAAQTPDEAPVQLSWGMTVTLAAGAYDGQDTDPEPLLGRWEGWIDGNAVFEDQSEVGFALGLSAEADHPRNDPRGDAEGAFQNGCAPTTIGCVGSGAPSFRSIHAGLAQGGLSADRGARLQAETAYVYWKAPIGEVSLGRQRGIAARFAPEGLRDTFGVGATDPLLDLTGLNGPRVRDTLSGPSAKVVVASERILGVQLGAAYTPDVEAAGLDHAHRFGPPGTLGATPDSVLELGASLDLRPPGADVGVIGGLTFSRAEADAVSAPFGDVDTITASAGLVGQGWRLGIAALEGNNGWDAGGDRDYRAVSVQGTIEHPDWALGLEIATSSDDLTNIDTRALVIAATVPLSNGAAVAVGVQGVERRNQEPGIGRRTERATGAFVAWTWTFTGP